ncbi:MAG: small subunit ribosomal protein [Solirubrobacteraceae bacterium]|nr:small subunit ribosomal protein [Solirubrobacteraceae bacterium]
MAEVGIAELLEAGVHFGHQTRRWNPKMRRFIHGERGGIYIIDLLKTSSLLAQAQEFADALAHRGGTVLFVGTKKQARDTIKDVAEAADMPFVNHRWLGGLLTNFQTINLRIRRLHDLERYEAEGQLALLPTRERMGAQADLAKLRANLGGVKNMQRVPDAMFVIDLKTEAIAVKEAQRLRIPIIGLVDTNCDPDGIDFVVPGNDDAIRSCALITQAIGQVVSEGHGVFRAEEERARKEAEERARIEAEERARREAEAKAAREAEEQAAREVAAAREAEQQAAQASAPPAAAPSPAPAAAGEPKPQAPAAPQAAPPPAAKQRQPPPAPPQQAPATEAAPAADETPAAAEAPATAEAPAAEDTPAEQPATEQAPAEAKPQAPASEEEPAEQPQGEQTKAEASAS